MKFCEDYKALSKVTQYPAVAIMYIISSMKAAVPKAYEGLLMA